jgi:hypothetical protein
MDEKGMEMPIGVHTARINPMKILFNVVNKNGTVLKFVPVKLLTRI